MSKCGAEGTLWRGGWCVEEAREGGVRRRVGAGGDGRGGGGSAEAQLSAPPPPIKSYVGDPGTLGDPASWRTPEFTRDSAMLSIGAEFAYAAGYAGAGMNIGIVDSGSFFGHMREHGSLDTNYTVGDRFLSVVAQGGNTGPTPGFYRPGVQRHPRHARQRHRGGEPRRRR